MEEVAESYDFRLGDRVVFVAEKDPDRGVFRGQVGTVCNLNEEYEEGCIAVEWDEESDRYHDCSGACKDRHGWWVPQSMLKHFDVDVDLGELSPSEIPLVLLLGFN